MTRYVYGSTKKRTASKGKKRTASKGKKMRGGRKTSRRAPAAGIAAARKIKQKGVKKGGFLGGLLKPLVLPALFFGAQKMQQKRVRRTKSKK